jgi:CelD/BcsL family acetyltransferase involved in cellulose biosynthesis
MSALSTRRWSVEEWLASEAAWNSLLARSDADALFLSWQWLTHWWRFYGDALGLDPQILAFYRGDQLVGLAPLYQRRVLRAGFVRALSVQMIGLSWRDPVPLVSEYLDVIATPADLEAVRDECVRVLLERPGWTEVVIGFTAVGRQWREAFARRLPVTGHYVRELDPSVSYHADLSRGFAAYLRDLGQSSRRSIWNLRRRLSEEHGEVRCEFVGAAELDAGFDDLNRLHQLRWNRPAFSSERLEFHKSFAAGLAARGELAFARLRVAGQVVSVLYDIRKGTRQYNMKMGFDPALTNRLSLGLVHFGYALEAAAERGIALYDFLAGPGQSYDFKRNLGQIRCDLSGLQMLRGALLPRLYRWRDRAR